MAEPTLPGDDVGAPSSDSQQGDRESAGGYALDRHVGSDAYGEIYVGVRDDDRRVVTLLSDRIVIDTVAARRFGDEVARISTLHDVGILSTVDFDLEVNPRWIASEFVTGQFLRQRIETGGALSPTATRALADQLARALQGLHALGVVQRDLSPDSILLTRDGARIWHSGWAGLVDGSEYAGTVHTEHVEWLAPEQVLGEASTPASDVHAWAITVLYAATCHNPFEAPNASESVSRLIRDTPLIPALFDPVLASLIAGALSKDPASRPTARDLLLYLSPDAAVVADAYVVPTSSDSFEPANSVEAEAVVGDVASRAPAVNLLKSSKVETAASTALGGGEMDADKDIEIEDWDAVDLDRLDELDDEEEENDLEDEAVIDGRIGFVTVGFLGIIVVTIGSVVGLLFGRVLGG